MKRVLITGASGFVGASVARQLVQQGRSVAVLVRSTSDTRRLAPLMNQLEVIRGDLANLTDSAQAIRDFAPEGVVHLAWEGVKGADRNAGMQTGNINSSVVLYRLAEELNCQQFVGLGSQAEYGPAPGKLDESGPTRPTTLYGAAKLATGLVLERMAATTGRRLAWLRLFSSYGPDDDPSWLLQYVTRCLLQGQRPALTAGEQRWDYIHVEDVARAVIAALDRRAHGFFNLGSGQATPVRQIIEQLRNLIDPRLPLGFGEVPYRPDQVMHLEADIAALSAATGWQPEINFEEGLRQLVAWHRGLMHAESNPHP